MSGDPEDYPPSVMWETCPRARKAHKCQECRAIIPAGTRYKRITGVWDHEFMTIVMCLVCDRLHDYMRMIDRAACFTELHEAISEAGMTEWVESMIGNAVR